MKSLLLRLPDGCPRFTGGGAGEGRWFLEVGLRLALLGTFEDVLEFARHQISSRPTLRSSSQPARASGSPLTDETGWPMRGAFWKAERRRMQALKSGKRASVSKARASSPSRLGLGATMVKRR